MMQWEKLLSLKKFGDTTIRDRNNESPLRVNFEVDYDRITFSPAFRKLQDKTQVVPLSHVRFAHTRLTHSLEVSVVGRSLGRIAGEYILNKYPNLVAAGYQTSDFGAIVAAAGLAHDIGNPPFGHSGESSIGYFFEHGAGTHFKNQMTPLQWNDLRDFEGNANGFRILTESKHGKDGGLRLTYATLGAFLKYPKPSIKINQPLSFEKKYNYFQNDESNFKDLVKSLELMPSQNGHYYRHPLAYLVEAADDICYAIIDFEDGLNLGWLPEELALELFVPMLGSKLKNNYFKYKTLKDRAAYLRAVAIGALIQEVGALFCSQEENILQGTYTKSLIDNCTLGTFVKDIKTHTRDKVYNHQSVLELQVNGFKAINYLLELLSETAQRVSEGNATYFDKNVVLLLPEEYREEFANPNVYKRQLAICYFLSDLSDAQLMNLYRNFAGHGTNL